MNIPDNDEDNRVDPGPEANDMPKMPPEDWDAFGDTALITIPKSPDDFVQPKSRSVIDEMEAMMRHPEYYAIAEPLLREMASAGPYTHGSWGWNRVKLVVDFKDAATRNGFVLLGKANLKEISHAITHALPRLTGKQVTLRKLHDQSARLRLEDQRKRDAAE